jgi:hypothetical protein
MSAVIILSLAEFILLIAIIALNVWASRDSAGMTPEEREADNEDTLFETSIWQHRPARPRRACLDRHHHPNGAGRVPRLSEGFPAPPRRWQRRCSLGGKAARDAPNKLPPMGR